MKTILLLIVALFAGGAAAKPTAELSSAAHSPLVPYDRAQALESFSKTVHGGILHIVAKSADNAEQIRRIQDYLRQTAAEFQKGDFSSTERYHGPDMPGLAQMKVAQPGEIRFDFKRLPDGGQIHFSTEYAPLLTALHHWFDAQIAEHGSAALPEHSQHHATPTE
ncbi:MULTISPECIES: hypothetical protein [Methylomonas]|uniref:Aspartate carbamoyltransferase n=1 Tax=Methylomonas koyamae TaxID=702114 RepID=A0A177NNP4_9GAMM|nr:hypothetical protein [Methylomonas koyamae]OAI18983.1 aspartate carbamoyltransferase [Methylomonas koyamae]